MSTYSVDFLIPLSYTLQTLKKLFLTKKSFLTKLREIQGLIMFIKNPMSHQDYEGNFTIKCSSWKADYFFHCPFS